MADGLEGEACHRDADCQLGLDCIRSRCTDPTVIPLGGPEDGVAFTCEAVVLSSNLPVTEYGSTASESNLHSGFCGGNDSPEVVYSLRLESPTFLDIWVYSDDFAPTLYLRAGCDPAAEIACSVSYYYGGAELFVSLDPGQYYIFVEGGGGEFADFELFVDGWIEDY